MSETIIPGMKHWTVAGANIYTFPNQCVWINECGERRDREWGNRGKKVGGMETEGKDRGW